MEGKKFKRRNKFYHHAINSKKTYSSAQTEFLTIYNDDDDVLDLQNLYDSEKVGSGTLFTRENSLKHHYKDIENEPEPDGLNSNRLNTGQKSAEFLFARWRRKSFKALREVHDKPATEAIDENCIKRPPLMTEESMPSNEKEFYSPISSPNESNERTINEKIQKEPSKEGRENNKDLSPVSFLSRGKSDFKNWPSQDFSPCSFDLIKEDVDKKTKLSTLIDTKTKLTRVHRLNDKTQQNYSLASIDKVKVFKAYFPGNNVTEVINKQRKLSMKKI